MGKLNFLMLMVFISSMQSFAIDYVRINNDIKTLSQLEANNAHELGVNNAQNSQVDSIRKKQVKLSALFEDIKLQQLLYIRSMQNIDGFREKKQIYKSIAKVGNSIIINSGKALTQLSKSNLKGKADMIVKIGSLVGDAVDLGVIFSSVIANGKVKNPIENKNNPQNNRADDGYNLLNRHQRLSMANLILHKLYDINSSLIYATQLGKWGDGKQIFRKLDYDAYIKAIRGEYLIKDIISEWNGLKQF